MHLSKRRVSRNTMSRRILESAGCKVLTAANGEAALVLLERHEEPVHLMLTDVVMPGMTGRELADSLEVA